MSRVLFAALCLSSAVVAGLDVDKKAEAPVAGPLPRYRLTPGRQIDYRVESVFKYEAGKTGGEMRRDKDWTGWVLRANPDGSTRVLVREVNHFVRVQNGKASEDAPTTEITYTDVFPDGRMLPNPTTRYKRGPAALFPQLPRTEAEAKAGWEGTADDAKVAARPLPAGQFSTTTVDAKDKIYLSTRKATFQFDPAVGLIAKGETESTQGYGIVGKTVGSFKLTADRTLPVAEFEKLAADAVRYFPATAAYDEVVEAAGKLPPDRAKTALADALKALKVAADGIAHPDLKSALAERVKAHDSVAANTLEEAKRRDQFVGKPAFAFDAVDLADKAVKLGDLRGKVVVLDFWYRGCGWCIKAMPQMNQLVGDFAGEPVAILGMNTDSDKADAELVVKAMELKYPTLRVEHAMADKFGVQGFPTLVVIDKSGVVRDLHVGYTATLRDDVGKTIRRLLAEKPPQ